MRLTALVAALGALLASLAPPAEAGQTHVAVAANFTEPAKEIAALFKQKTGTNFQAVPYKSSAESATALLTNQVTLSISDVPPVVVELLPPEPLVVELSPAEPPAPMPSGFAVP